MLRDRFKESVIGNTKIGNVYGYRFDCRKSAACWPWLHNSQKAVWMSPSGEIWIGDNPGEEWAEISMADLLA